ncbi:tocopherol O-methyltransferase, putative [Ricinus communis]|uniref:Tocopherol O-methyltransferase, putative n=1 Tax=Ricinus communis TaxID=3988 RepID=B9S270_RICCO|nr:tocopherol O-methyltransferase, putative [Ricinus communis]
MLHIQPPIPNLRTCHFPSSSFSSLRFSLPTSSFSFPSRARFTRVVTAAVTSPEMEALDAKVLKQGIAELYDESSGVWEDIWGDHMHHGFYDPDVQVSASLSNHRAAQIRMIEEALRFAGVSEFT